MTSEYTKAFMDVRCAKCGKRYGWFGTMFDAPPCPRCGDVIPMSDLAHDQAIMEDFREFLSENPMSTKGRTMRARMRLSAGLSVGQAARLLDISKDELLAIENEQADPTPALNEQMIDAYGMNKSS